MKWVNPLHTTGLFHITGHYPMKTPSDYEGAILTKRTHITEDPTQADCQIFVYYEVFVIHIFYCSYVNFKSRIEFNPNQHQKIRNFPLFSGGIERDQCHEIG